MSVENGLIALTETSRFLQTGKRPKREAVHAKKDSLSVIGIRIAGAGVSDEDLQSTLVKKLQYDRVGYGTTPFNAIGVSVHEGVVTLGGHAYGPMDKTSAHAAAAYTPGVQDVIDEIQVDPVSSMDDRIRLNVARLIYGHSSLLKYAIDPVQADPHFRAERQCHSVRHCGLPGR